MSASIKLPLALSLALLVPGILAGCSDAAPQLGVPGQGFSGFGCSDGDGDGYGPNCMPGADCDDGDATITDACYRCDEPAEGCPCDADGERVACGEVTSKIDGQLVCGYGETACSAGAWGACIINNSVTLPPTAQPGPGTQTLGTATVCTSNPCSLDCQQFTDTPVGLGGDGVTEGDGGLTLSGEPAQPTFDICFGGAEGTCSHSVCGPGAALEATCDSPASPPVTLFSETFANNSAGWTRGTEWEIGAADASSGQTYGSADPALDHTATSDNGVAGVVLGGHATNSAHGSYYLTSPTFDGSADNGTLTLSYFRWLNTERTPSMSNSVEVYDGDGWVVLEAITERVSSSSWAQITVDVTAYASASMRVRFGVAVPKSSHAKVSSWNLDDVKVVRTPPAPPPSCVDAVCDADPTCCSGTWSQACIALVPTTCDVTCATVGSTCTLCHEDATDHDGDGYSFAQGDCLDCDVQVNPGAFDFPDNGVDEDCSGTADDEPEGCDDGLSLTTTNPLDHARAVDLCRMTSAGATGAQRTWGVITGALVQADGTSAPSSLGYGVLTKFGAANLPQRGVRMAAYSSGAARAAGDPGFVNPSGQIDSLNQGKSCAFPPGFPKNAQGCPTLPSKSLAYDSAGLSLKVRVPTNAKSLSYKFNFFSSEYPEWVCDYYNDSFVALMGSSYLPANPAANSGNISFDANNNPVTVNIGFFTVTSGPKLAGTGYDGLCDGQVCGGATDWLQTTAPVVPGEEMTMRFAIWDTGDHVWDSTVLIDDWQWSIEPATIETFVPTAPSGTTYATGTFERDYDVSGACAAGTTPRWGLWSWSSTTPGDSSVAFRVQTAATHAALASAPEDALQFSSVPGPVALAGQPVVAKAGSPDTQGGSADVDTTLEAAGRAPYHPHLRVTASLAPSSDGTLAPTLSSWNLQFTCVPSD